MAGLKFNNNLTSDAASRGGFTIDFEPSLAIMAGRYDTLGIEIQKFKTPLQRAVKQVMLKSIATNFASGGRPPWEGLSAETLKRRPGGRPLVDTGNLSNVASSEGIWTITDKSATVRSLPGAEYGGIHQSGASFGTRAGSGGGTALSGGSWVKVGRSKKWVPNKSASKRTTKGGSGTIPQRKFLVIQPEDGKAIEEVFAKWLAQISNLSQFRR